VNVKVKVKVTVQNLIQVSFWHMKSDKCYQLLTLELPLTGVDKYVQLSAKGRKVTGFV